MLQYFRANPAEYDGIYRECQRRWLVGEVPIPPGGAFALTVDNHNSVNGIREFARAKGASVTYVPMLRPELRIDEAALHRTLHGEPGNEPRLFAFPPNRTFPERSIR